MRDDNKIYQLIKDKKVNWSTKYRQNVELVNLWETRFFIDQPILRKISLVNQCEIKLYTVNWPRSDMIFTKINQLETWIYELY